MSVRRLAVAGVAAGLLGAGVGPVAPAGAAGAAETVEASCVGISAAQPPEEVLATDADSRPLELMGVGDATAAVEAQGKVPGQGVVVAVLDSGIPDSAGLPVVDRVAVSGVKQPPSYYHGSAVGGLIAGPARPDDRGGAVGIAPGAQLLDVQVYDDPGAEDAPDSDASPITEANVVEGLDAVLARMGTLNIKVVTIALALPFDSPAIESRLKRIWKQGAVVVASTGNRPGGEEGDTSYLSELGYATHRPGEDVRDVVHPADVRNVLGVNASVSGAASDDPLAYVLENSATDVAAPTAGAVSYAPVGGTCVLADPATSWAAAEVSGALAVIQSVYDESPARAVARLEWTANGRPDVPNTLLGAGEVQLDEAVTRPLQITGSGEVVGGVVRDEQQQLAAPEDPPDLLASTRANAVWWGLVGGGVLLLAVVLRPVLARRRRSTSATL